MDEHHWRGIPRSGPRPVEGGLRVQSRRGDIGETWWSRRFIAILESLGFGSRLDRGRHYARRGQVVDLDVRAGVVEARVQGSRPRPYRVRLGVEPLSEEDWANAERAMAAKALFAARLLSGEMPREIEEAFAACDLSLFPASAGQLSSACSCPDWASPCKHVAAVFYVLAEAFDADPFLVFTWRGRTRERLLERLADLRAPAAEPAARAPAGEPLTERLDDFWQAGAGLDEVPVRPWAEPGPDAGPARDLAPPGLTAAGRDLGEGLAELRRLAGEAARRRALGPAPEEVEE